MRLNEQSRLKQIWKKIIPEKQREKFWLFIGSIKINRKRKEILAYYKDCPDDLHEQIKYIKKYGLAAFPYFYTRKYLEYAVESGHEGDLPYVIHNGKKIYGPREWDELQFVKYYKSLIVEQDAESPHKYLPDGMKLDTNDIVADIGAAEGIFTLDVIEDIKEAYLFEADSKWIEPLEKTFEDYSTKVHIIPKYVGRESSNLAIVSLDDFFSEIPVTFIKADIEGAERDMILGGKEIFKKTVKSAVICTYHKPNDYDELSTLLKEYGFEVKPSGYMLRMTEILMSAAPYFRRGVVRAKKVSNSEYEKKNR